MQARTTPTVGSPFPLGKVVATPAALKEFGISGEPLHRFLERHGHGDWGDLCKEDMVANDTALRTGARILSAYHLGSGVKVWIITEADRSSTCILLPDDY